MLFSTRGRYALRVMVELAQQNTEELVPLKNIAQSQELSLKYLESIMVVLSKAGFVKAQHGKNGGYQLSRKPEEYSVAEILTLLDGSPAPVDCLKKGAAKCPREQSCSTLPMWKELSGIIEEYLKNKTLRDLITEQNLKKNE